SLTDSLADADFLVLEDLGRVLPLEVSLDAEDVFEGSESFPDLIFLFPWFDLAEWSFSSWSLFLRSRITLSKSSSS
nr:hypothetical protein [Tanacetum cinerariifolium]